MRAHHLLAALLLMSAACAYESSTIESLRCAPEGARETGRVCQSGVWVQDTTLTPDLPLDLPDDVEPDATEEMCIPLPDSFYCEQAGAQCGTLTRLDNCGVTRPVPCGECEVGECGAAGANLCQCDCEIDGVCRGAGMPNPDNACQVCDPEVSATAWSPHNAGDTCAGPGTSACNPGTCDDAGACVPSTETCAMLNTECTRGECINGATCRAVPINIGDSCTSSQQLVAGCEQSTCDNTGACTVKPVEGTCILEGQCLQDGQTPTGKDCLVCDGETGLAIPTQNLPADICGASNACTTRSCVNGSCAEMPRTGTGCLIDGACYNDGATRPGFPCQRCIATAPNPNQWKNEPVDTACDSMLNMSPEMSALCAQSACNNEGICRINAIINPARCLINGSCYIPNRPVHSCQYCDPALNQRVWTMRATGYACTDASSQSCKNEMDNCECTNAGVCAP